MNKNEILKALDEMDAARRKAEINTERYPKDYIFRLCEAILAKHAGYTERCAWTDELRADASTEYHAFFAD